MDGGDKWNYNREYQIFVEGFAFLVKECENNQDCEALMKRIIEPLMIPLKKKINLLKEMDL